MGDTVHLRIKRQSCPSSASFWEEFKVSREKNMNIVSALMQIQLNPVNIRGEKTRPVVWECSCLEEVCGACTMLINGRSRQACSALVDQLAEPITLEPLSKFPVVCDLMVDRQRIFEDLKKVHAWVDIDGTHNIGLGPRMPDKVREYSYLLSRCMSCGCCLEACPQYHPKSAFLGAAIFGQVKLFNNHPSGSMYKEERLNAIMGPGGVADCGNAQNCERVCPKELPLTRVIAELNRDTSIYGIKRWLAR